MALSVTVRVLAVILFIHGCTHTFPLPDNKNYTQVGQLYYCYGEARSWTPGATFTDDPCRPDPCADMKVPEDKCLGLGEVPE